MVKFTLSSLKLKDFLLFDDSAIYSAWQNLLKSLETQPSWQKDTCPFMFP